MPGAIGKHNGTGLDFLRVDVRTNPNTKALKEAAAAAAAPEVLRRTFFWELVNAHYNAEEQAL
jgi:hypothetical protein